MDLSLVGERLRREREHAGLEQHQLAERAQLSTSTVIRIGDGTHAAVTLAELDHLAITLGIPVRRLTSGSSARSETEKADTGASRPRRVDLPRLIERGRPEGERRLTVNPDPLKVVAERPGGSAPDRDHVLALKLAMRPDGTDLQRVSIHREGCPRIPVVDGRNGWVSKIATRDEIGRVVEQADKADVPTSISCRTCGGWSSLP
ncbi:helix-turn-helix domain-containing protein [Streptomyces sp. NPDC058947]|uniref:helix-turn-helix domain-containing protein n=1 Tax=Streptomyces sp. NPDC058947 TaxID=3346675 RepID=UPI003673B5CF